uniref:Homing endonuclease LAGLIDADG domain-containing protein n=1 Tax=Percursaria percursa TaxID=153906 RepID=A0A8K1N1A2_9CHLO|nr:hypothetical protein [Percursaria percursa]
MKYKIKKSVKKSFISSETTREGIHNNQKNTQLRWAIGLIDGDGHIGIEWSNKEKTKWAPILKVTLHRYNSRSIYRLKKILGIGRVTYSKNTITYRVRSRALWNSTLIPIFEQFHLRSTKYGAALVVKEALHMAKIQKVLPETIEQLLKLIKIAGPNQISPIWNATDLKAIVDLDWLAGFIEAEGSFYILSTGQHGFAIGQAYNWHIISAIHGLFGVKSALKQHNNYCMLDTKNTQTLHLIAEQIGGRLLGIKSFEFSLWLRTLRKKKKTKSLKAKLIIASIRQRLFYK